MARVAHRRSCRGRSRSCSFSAPVCSRLPRAAHAQAPAPRHRRRRRRSRRGRRRRPRHGRATPRGAVVQTTTSDAAGAFSLRGLAPGTYSVLVEMNLFAPVTERVDGARVRIRRRLFARCSRPADLPRASSSRPGAWKRAWRRRRRRSKSSTPPTSSASVAADLTDVLKKNAGVDVVQYSGALSGIGIRGFRPQFSGINKRSLLLIDGRPSGVTNLATLLLDNVERIEVLKGAASAVYGSSAMGGVVNVITRQSRGKIGGNARDRRRQLRHVGVRRTRRRQRRRRASTSTSTGSAFDQRDDYPHGQRRRPAGDELQDVRRHRRASASISRAAGASTAAPTAIAGATS